MKFTLINLKLSMINSKLSLINSKLSLINMNSSSINLRVKWCRVSMFFLGKSNLWVSITES